MLSLKFNYAEQEFIDYQLYIVSKSPIIQKKSRRNRWLVSLIYLGIGAFGGFTGNMNQLWIFGALAIVWYVVYPIWSSRFHKKQYTRFIKTQNKNRIGSEVKIEINNTDFKIEEAGQFATISLRDFSEIAELKNLLLVRLKSDMVIILQKQCSIPKDTLIDYMKSIAVKLSIPYVDDTHWTWK